MLILFIILFPLLFECKYHIMLRMLKKNNKGISYHYILFSIQISEDDVSWFALKRGSSNLRSLFNSPLHFSFFLPILRLKATVWKVARVSLNIFKRGNRLFRRERHELVLIGKRPSEILRIQDANLHGRILPTGLATYKR